MNVHKEIRFEEAIEVALTTEGGFQKGAPGSFDAERALSLTKRPTRPTTASSNPSRMTRTYPSGRLRRPSLAS